METKKDIFGLNQFAREIMTEIDFEKFDYSSYVAELTKYMVGQGLDINPLPNVRFINDDETNANDFFGRTAYYDPNEKLIALYTLKRHPKDVLRSFSHEMIHHMQNIQGRLHNITTQNTNEDDTLNELEREAYEKGNMNFRNWTDSLKK